MSRFSVLIHQHFGTGAANETVADIIVKHIPDTAQLADVREIVSDAVAIFQGTGISGDEKKKLATVAINYALAAAHISLSPSIVSYLIEEAVVLLKGGKSSTPAPAPVPAPVDDPYSVDYTSSTAAAAAGRSGDRVYDKHDGKFRLVYGGAGAVVPNGWTLVETVG